MAKTIAVLGVTGKQGGSVASKFLSQGWNVRGITRSATSDAAKAQAAKGISIVEADVDKPSTLVAAFRGAHVVFAVTDFWAPFFEAYERLSKISNTATGEYSYAIEVQRGKHIVNAVQQVLEEDGTLERFILSTLPGFTKQSGGKYTHAFHFDSKAEISEYLKSKGDLWARSSLLNMTFYSTNLDAFRSFGKPEERNPFVLRTPGSIDAVHPWVVTEDTGLFAELLVRSPPQQDLLAVSETASFRTAIKLWSEASGIPATAQEITLEDADRADPGGMQREAGESTCTSAEFGWGDHLVLPTDLDPEIKTTSLKQALESQEW